MRIEKQNILQRNKNLIDKHRVKYLTQINPSLSKLKKELKIHNEDTPIRPVVNNLNSSTYKLAKYLHKIYKI